jgi:hypothetical protein
MVLPKHQSRELSELQTGVDVSGDTLTHRISQMIAEGKLRQTTKKICVPRELPAYEVLDPPKSPSFDWLPVGLLAVATVLNISLLALQARRKKVEQTETLKLVPVGRSNTSWNALRINA